MARARTIKDAFGKVECYTSNISELAGEIEDQLILDSDNKIVIELNGVVSLIQTFWNKIKETARECEGKEIEVRLPAGFVGQLVGFALATIGFKL